MICFHADFIIIRPKILCRHVNKFYSMLRTLKLPPSLPSQLSFTVSGRTLNSFHMHSKMPDNDYSAPPTGDAVSFEPLLSMAKIFWFGICKYGHVCYYTKYVSLCHGYVYVQLSASYSKLTFVFSHLKLWHMQFTHIYFIVFMCVYVCANDW